MTDEPDNSLLSAADRQLELIPSDQMEASHFEELEAKGEFTGERLFKQRPRTYVEIVSLLAEGLGVNRIGRILHVSGHTVRAVRDREPAAIATVKERIARQAYHGASMCVDAILEDLDDAEIRKKIATRDLAVTMGVLVDKAQLLSGGATSRPETITRQADHDDFTRMLEEAVRTGSAGEMGGQKGEPPIDAEFEMVDEEPAAGQGERAGDGVERRQLPEHGERPDGA